MAIAKFMISVLALMVIALGVLWMGQGLGVVRWPNESFMIDVSAWTVRGAILTAAGLLMLVLVRR